MAVAPPLPGPAALGELLMPAARYHRLRRQLQAQLSPPRMAHSLGVMITARAMAPTMGADPAAAELAGLVHDIAKELPAAALARLARAAGITYSHPCERHPVYLHATVGAHLAEAWLGVREHAVLDAIAAHSQGGPDPRLGSPLVWCLRLADLTELHRRYGAANAIRWAWAHRGWRPAAHVACTNLLRYLRQENIPCHPNVLQVIQELGE